MDWITQAALGALVGELVLGRRLGKRALAWGALFGIWPDMDFLVSPLLSTAREVAWHRGPLHSLVIMALGSWGFAQGLAKLWRREKIGKPLAGAFVFAVWWMHVLVDCSTVEGAAVLWPFLDKRFAFSFLPQVDFLFSAPLVVCAVWLAILRPSPLKKGRGKSAPPPAKRRKLCYWGIGLSAAYASIAVGMKFLVTAGFDADLARRGIASERRMESPTRFNILLWRAVVDRGDEFWVGYRSVFEARESPVRWTVYLRDADALAKIADMRETKTLRAVSDGWWLARLHAKGAWLGDLRFPETRVWGSKKGMVDSRLAISWVIDASDKNDHLREIFPDAESSGDYLQHLSSRIFSGSHESWEANPRLAGVAGSLPEFLPVEE